MTVSSADNREDVVIATGTADYDFNFRIFAADDLLVKSRDDDGVETTLVLNTDYTVTGAGDYNGGHITLSSGYRTAHNDEDMTILRVVEVLQETSIRNQGKFYPETHEDVFDRLVMIDQQQQEELGRSLRLPETVSAGDVDVTLPVPESNKLIGWNPDANQLQNIDPSTLGTIVAYGTANVDKFEGDGVTTQFTLSDNPGALGNLDISVGGITQTPGVHYNWTAGTVLSFLAAPAAPAVPGTKNILVRYMQALPQGTSDASSASYVPPGTGAVTTNVQAKLRERISVKDFGAVGDGVTDDSAAVQLAVSYAGLLVSAISLRGAGVEIYFPSGSYLFLSTVTVTKHGIGFVGDAGKGSEIKGDILLFDVGDATNVSRLRRTFFRNLNFGATNTANTTAAIKLYRATDTVFEDCLFNDFNIGIDCYRASKPYITRCSFHSATRTAQAAAFIKLQGTDESAFASPNTYTPGGGVHITDCEFEGAVTGGAGAGLYDTTAGILVMSCDGMYVSNCHFMDCFYSVQVSPDASAANRTIADLNFSNCYFDEPSAVVANPYNVKLMGSVDDTIALASGSGSSTYQSIRFSNCYFRGSSSAARNFEVAVTDADSWWNSGKQLKDIVISGNTFRQAKRQQIYFQPSSGNFVEAFGVVIDGNFFEEGNSSGTASEGSAIHLNVESVVVSNNVIDAPAGTSDYAILINTTDVGDDQANPSAAVVGNDVSYGTYTTEPVRISVGASSLNSKSIQSGNVYPGPGRIVKQQYKLTTTDETTQNIHSFVIPAGVAGTVTATLSGSNANGTKAVAYQFYTGFRNNGALSSLSSGGAAWATVRAWNPDAIATIPTAALSTNTLQVQVTGVAAETWTWVCDIDMSCCK